MTWEIPGLQLKQDFMHYLRLWIQMVIKFLIYKVKDMIMVMGTSNHLPQLAPNYIVERIDWTNHGALKYHLIFITKHDGNLGISLS